MLYFRDHHWIVRHASTRFSALINTNHAARDDIFWMLDIEAVAGGPAWRRVQCWERPMLSVRLSSFKPQIRDWTGLEHLNYWTLEYADNNQFRPLGGYVDAAYREKTPAGRTCENSFINDAIWRVAGRREGFFNVEFAAFADGQNLHDILFGRPVAVLPDGREERPEPDAEFWRANSTVYFIEEIPFGTVTVRVPRNVRDPEAYALRRANDLIGIPRPEHIEVTDHWKTSQRNKQECPEGIQQDIFVELHLNGYYQD